MTFSRALSTPEMSEDEEAETHGDDSCERKVKQSKGNLKIPSAVRVLSMLWLRRMFVGRCDSEVFSPTLHSVFLCRSRKRSKQEKTASSMSFAAARVSRMCRPAAQRVVQRYVCIVGGGRKTCPKRHCCQMARGHGGLLLLLSFGGRMSRMLRRIGSKPCVVNCMIFPNRGWPGISF